MKDIIVDNETMRIVEKFSSSKVEIELSNKLERESFTSTTGGGGKATVVVKYLSQSKRNCRVIVMWEHINKPSYGLGLVAAELNKGYQLWIYNNERYCKGNSGWKLVKKVSDVLVTRVLSAIAK